MIKHDPHYYAMTHRKGLLMVNALYAIGLVSVHFNGYDTAETIRQSYIAFLYWFSGALAIETLSWWYRKLWMDGPFKCGTVIQKMVYSKPEDALDIARNVAVWPAKKTNEHIKRWKHDVNVAIHTLIVMNIVVLVASIWMA